MPGSPLEGDLRSLGFDVRTAPEAASPEELEALLRDLPAGERVALVDSRFVGHVHALRLGLTDPRFPVSAVPGAVTAQAGARRELTTALRTAVDATGADADVRPWRSPPTPVPDRIAAAIEATGTDVHRPELGTLVAALPGDPESRNTARASRRRRRRRGRAACAAR
ncbi:transferase [Streptomyces alboflavus]|uniref:Transferase n=1 Tax=Streptomyces alboflavus TaxID=67267 RepID=A0A1Z1WN76_9ACTN|nr:transferase [Streptomyces alboflavus]